MMHRGTGYAYIWRYVVRPEFTEDFETAYGPEGPWAALFSNADGYERTELYRDSQAPQRYLTIDYWKSVEAWRAFRGRMSAQYEAIDNLCSRFTLEEKELGQLLSPDSHAG